MPGRYVSPRADGPLEILGRGAVRLSRSFRYSSPDAKAAAAAAPADAGERRAQMAATQDGEREATRPRAGPGC